MRECREAEVDFDCFELLLIRAAKNLRLLIFIVFRMTVTRLATVLTHLSNTGKRIPEYFEPVIITHTENQIEEDGIRYFSLEFNLKL